MKKKLIILLFLYMNSLFSQNDGFWDKERATNKTITASAFKKIVVASEDFPVGTTQFLFRITLLNDNQELASSLTSLLKSIPDPTGISQGSAGAVFLLSKISGNDTCKFALFASEIAANNFVKNANSNKACYAQNTPTNKEAKLISLQNDTCLSDEVTKIFFVFENKNWILNQKIVLEIVPWVDYKLSRGYNMTHKKSLLATINQLETAQKLAHSGLFTACILEYIQKNYKYSEFQNLLEIEKNKVLYDFEKKCISEIGLQDELDTTNRQHIAQLADEQNFEAAIEAIHQTFIKFQKANAQDYSNLGYYYLMTKQFSKGKQALENAEKLAPSDIAIKLRLAHALVLNNEFRMAKNIHKTYRNENISSKVSWIEQARKDLDLFKKYKIEHEDFDNILELFE